MLNKKSGSFSLFPLDDSPLQDCFHIKFTNETWAEQEGKLKWKRDPDKNFFLLEL